jgi:hypothetical protein
VNLDAITTSTWRHPLCNSVVGSVDRLAFEHITKIRKATVAAPIAPSLRL